MEHAAYTAGKRELIFMPVTLVCGMLLCNFTLYGGWNLGFAVAAFCCILCAAGYLLLSGYRPGVYGISLLAISLALAAGFARSDDGFVKLVCFSFLMISTGLGLTLTVKKNYFHPGGFASLADAFCTVFARGVAGCGSCFRGLSGAVRQSGNAVKKGGAAALGIVIAAPVLVITVFLLSQADAAFQGLMEQLPDLDLAEGFVTLHFGALAGIWLYCTAVSLHSKPAPETKPEHRAARMNPITVNTVLVCLCAVYGIYLFSQLAYFSGGFAGILPQGYSLAEYARRGFFEMALLSGLNLLVIGLMLGFVKKETKAPLSTRLMCLFLGLVTLFLIVSASAKMFFYIESYGLTRLRVLTQIVMLFLALTTLVVMAWMFLPRLPYMKVVLLTALLLGTLTLWVDVDTQVARYNVDAYLSGKLEQVDTFYLMELNSGAVPHILRLAQEAQDPLVVAEVRTYLQKQPQITQLRQWNYADAIAAEYDK